MQELAAQREQARARRDFAAADALRRQILDAGWEVADTPTGSRVTRRPVQVASFARDGEVPDSRDAPDTCGHSLCIAFHGWPEDVARLAHAVCAQAPAGSVELLLGLAAGAPDPPPSLLNLELPGLCGAPRAVRVENAGHAQAYNAAARLAGGRLVHFVEPSLEFGFEALGAADAVLSDHSVGACGPFGLTTDDWREFRPDPGPDVMALEYLVSARRADLHRVGEMDPGYRYYRNLDLDFSRQVAAAGFELRTYGAPVERHTHRLWDSTSPDERERLSRRNFNRLLDRWVRGGEGSAAPPRP